MQIVVPMENSSCGMYEAEEETISYLAPMPKLPLDGSMTEIYDHTFAAI